MKTLSQRVALIFGVVFILVAILGFIAPGGTGMGMSGMLLGLFPINLLHNVVHLVFGAWGIMASRTAAGARTYCRLLGIIYLVLAILGYVAPTTFGLIPIGGYDIYLHVVLGLVLAGVGFTDKAAANS